MENALEFIRNNTNLNKSDYVVIGLSGGPDSMALLDILLDYQKEIKFNIVCAHVHHNIRKESDDEEIFVEKYCNSKKVIFEKKKLVYEGVFNESLGHELRYEFFDSIINKYNAKYLFTAHHGDDLIETILMRIVRGASFYGYRGFDQISSRGKYSILRPLIQVTKDDILVYLLKKKIPYVEDSSNNDVQYTRNRYRKFILPILKEEDNNVNLKFLKFSNILSEYNNFVERQVDKVYDEIVIDGRVFISKLLSQDSLIVSCVINRWLHYIYQQDINLINDRHVESIINLLNNKNKPNSILSLPNKELIRSYDVLYEKKFNLEFEYEYILNEEVILENGRKINFVESSNMTNNFVTYLCSSDIKLPLYVRNYRPGDKMSIKNMIGHKKIKDIYINEKMTINDRINQPIVVDSNNKIVWLPGIKKSAFDSQNSTKCDIILEYH